MRALSAATLALLLGGCAPAGGGLGWGDSAVVVAVAPDLRGTWTGSLAGTPLTLVISEQVMVGREGLYAGRWMIFGRQAPGLTGVLTSTIRGQTVMAAAEGELLVTATGGVVLIVAAPTTFGDQRLTLMSDGPDRFIGNGEATFGPRGAVFLTRTR